MPRKSRARRSKASAGRRRSSGAQSRYSYRGRFTHICNEITHSYAIHYGTAKKKNKFGVWQTRYIRVFKFKYFRVAYYIPSQNTKLSGCRGVVTATEEQVNSLVAGNNVIIENVEFKEFKRLGMS